MKTILAVDDDPAILKVVEVELTRAGFRVLVEKDALRVASRLAAEPVDLVVLDIMMPGKDGLSLCEELRRGGFGQPILFLTARKSSLDVLQGYAAGGQAYLAKPFREKDLLDKIRYALEPPGP